MAATLSQLRRWFAEGQAEGYQRMVVFCDTFDMADGDCCYPSYYNEVGDELRAVVKKSGDRLMEVYDLTHEGDQLQGGKRVFNYDSVAPEYVPRHRAENHPTEAVNRSFNR